ncbi:MAG: flagellar biosynthesis regulator FlaF [Pseudomonadota bacterium]
MSHDAYKKTSENVQGPRDAEYRAFCEATARLLRIAEEGRADLKAMIEALHFNRRLWGALASDCRSDENGLPKETRASIVSLSDWVSKYSSEIMRNKEAVEPLIEVNRMMMEGLSGKAPASDE